ncbi:gp53-like domain-containing protein [Enterobacter asburiae]
MLRIGQVEATATQDGKYTDGSVAGGIAATRLRAAAFNAMQEELAHIVESAGLALDINDMTQVLKAIQKLTLSRTNPFADIKSDGAAAISTALTNLGLGTAATKNVGTGSGQIPDMSSFTNASGWQKLPGGKILQWGKAGFPVGQTQISVPFPINFPSVVSNIQLTFADINFSGGTPSPTLAVVNNTVNGAGFGAYMSGAGGFNAYFFAIGS